MATAIAKVTTSSSPSSCSTDRIHFELPRTRKTECMLSPVKPWRFSNISRLQHNRHICVNSLHAHKTCHKIPSTPDPLPRQTHSTIKFMFVRNQPADISKRRKEKQEPRHLPTYKPATMPNTLYCSPKKMHLFSYQTSKAVNVTCRLYTGSQQLRLSETGF